MAEAIVFVGLQGAGKTTYFMSHFAGTHEHASRDIQGSAEREIAFIRECLDSQHSFVVDDTNATRAVRARYIQQAKNAGFQVVAYFFDVAVRTAIGRNNHRKDKRPIPVPAILRLAKILEAPSGDEGFEFVQTIKPAPDKSQDWDAG